MVSFLTGNIGLTIETIGEIILAVLVIMVHERLGKDGKVDGPVLKDIKLEFILGSFSILLIAVGYVLKLMGI
jgi:hypothetical protein